jgi:3-dehydroquinate synthase
MMKIQSRFKEYEVILEQDMGFIHRLAKTENAQFVIDKNVYELYGEYFGDVPKERLVIVEATENNKVVDTALDICEKITDIPAKRNATLISIGGGIIQDITGFVANITYRGINWIFVPTTLLAACDSCIGGKTSLNYKKFKNLLGTFFPPDEIHICSQMFQTLTERDFKSGLGEVVKFNIMAGQKGLENIENNISSLLARNPETINRFVETSLAFKKGFIEVDEFDKGERIKLNFAHTFGHSIEVITEYEIPHGTAVAIGMIMANSISYSRGLLGKDIVSRSENVLLKVIDINVDLLEKPLEEYMKAIRKDKKQVNSSLTAVLISKYGECGKLSVVHDITEEEIESAIEYFKKLYRDKKSEN